MLPYLCFLCNYPHSCNYPYHSCSSRRYSQEKERDRCQYLINIRVSEGFFTDCELGFEILYARVLYPLQSTSSVSAHSKTVYKLFAHKNHGSDQPCVFPLKQRWFNSLSSLFCTLFCKFPTIFWSNTEASLREQRLVINLRYLESCVLRRYN